MKVIADFSIVKPAPGAFRVRVMAIVEPVLFVYYVLRA